MCLRYICAVLDCVLSVETFRCYTFATRKEKNSDAANKSFTNHMRRRVVYENVFCIT